MRKTVLSLLTILLLLTACQSGGPGGSAPAEQTADEAARLVRTKYLAASGGGGTVEVTADYGLRVYDFTLDFVWRREGESVLTVTAPEELAGLTARIAEGEARLEFDGVSLGAGDLTGEGLTPMELLPSLTQYIDGGYMAQCVFEKLGEHDALRVLFRDPQTEAGTGTECTLWFHRSSHALLRCELSWDGTLVLSGNFTNFYLGDETNDTNEPGQDLGGDQPGEPGA